MNGFLREVRRNLNLYKKNSDENVDFKSKFLTTIKDLCQEELDKINKDSYFEMYIKNYDSNMDYVKTIGEHNHIYYDRIEGKFYNRGTDLYIDDTQLHMFGLS